MGHSDLPLRQASVQTHPNVTLCTVVEHDTSLSVLKSQQTWVWYRSELFPIEARERERERDCES
jgi:hypothetical protein